jgi:hypothetical protein
MAERERETEFSISEKNLPRISDFFRLLFGDYRREKENTEIKLRKKGALRAGGKRIFPFPPFFRL